MKDNLKEFIGPEPVKNLNFGREATSYPSHRNRGMIVIKVKRPMSLVDYFVNQPIQGGFRTIGTKKVVEKDNAKQNLVLHETRPSETNNIGRKARGSSRKH
jgi:hypothetical protein